MSELDSIRRTLELHLMRFYPEKYVPMYIKSVRDVYENRFTLRQIKYTEESFSYVVGLVVDAVVSNKRFRTLDCLKVIKKIVQNKPAEVKLSEEIKESLFFLYQKYVFHTNEEVRWAVAVYLKNEILIDSQIAWLLDHATENTMILNRVLRYPERHPLISVWAYKAHQQGIFVMRSSELVALLIDVDLPENINSSDVPMILWAIYYSRVDSETKKRLLLKYYSLEDVGHLIEICVRLRYVEVLEEVYDKLD